MSNTTQHDSLRKTRVLVTGGCGFIGSHLIERLVAHGANVCAFDNFQTGAVMNLGNVLETKHVHVVEGDARDATLVNRTVRDFRPQAVFHLAAHASVPDSVEDPAHDYETNCSGTFVLLNALRRYAGCGKFVFTSSGAVYGEPLHFPISEDDVPAPISPYGASKYAAEIETRMFQRVYGLPVVIARLFNAYGPRMSRFVIFDFLCKLERNPAVLEILGTGRQVRDFTFISDVVDGLLVLAASGRPGEAYNLSSGVSYSVAHVAHALLDALGLKDETRIVCTGTSWTGDAQHWEVNIQKLSALGYRAKVPLSSGLEATIDWFRQRSAWRRPAGRPLGGHDGYGREEAIGTPPYAVSQTLRMQETVG